MKKGVIWKNKLWIISAPVHSGKTSILGSWSKGKDVSGFLTPDRDGLRMLYNISKDTYIPFETHANDNNHTISVGKFTFLRSAFDHGMEMIHQSLSGQNQYFIVDEVGKLEMKDEGFGPAVNDLVYFLKHNDSTTIYLLVVRDYLVQDFLEKYQLEIENWEELE